MSKLRDKAQIACSNKIFEDFESLQSFLRQNFGERKHYSHLFFELQSCKQQPNESVSQFALRLETCLTDMQTEIHNSVTTKKDLPGRIAMTEDLALYTFNFGLNPGLSNMVRCRNPKNLNEAINIAIEEEKIRNFTLNVSAKMNKHCKFCKKSGHLESECLNKKRVSQAQSQSPKNEPHQVSKPPGVIICRYCKNPGHDISQCYKRKHNNLKKQSNFNSPATQHNVAMLPDSVESWDETENADLN